MRAGWYVGILLLAASSIDAAEGQYSPRSPRSVFGITLVSRSSDGPLADDSSPIDATDQPSGSDVVQSAMLAEDPANGNDSNLIDTPNIRMSDVFPFFSEDPSLSGVPPISDEFRPNGIQFFVDYDAFRGIADGGWENNGIRGGFNFASRLGSISELTGIGFQVGSSFGIYDWAGTDYRLQNQNRAESQGFLTYGFYRKPNENSPISAGVVQDLMFNYTYGVFGQSPTLSQLRGQIGYATSASNEFGLWGTAHVLSSTINVPNIGPVKWQSVNQISAYWHHKWYLGGPDTWLSFGLPSYDRLAGGGSLGDYLVTASSSCPLNDAVAIFSSVTYMHQSGGLGGENANDEAWNFTVGISIYPQRNARSRTVAGQRWMPLMPVANNGSFLVDTSKTY